MANPSRNEDAAVRGTTSREASEPPVSPRLSDLRELGRRGLFDFYRASYGDGRPVLVKVLASPMPGDAEMLAHEDEFTRRLNSRAILRSLAMTTHEGRPALVFEDFDGTSLDTMIDAGMDPTEFLRIAERITVAISEVHHEDVVHRDLKPENILVDATTGEVKITGFGLATRLPCEPQVVQSPRLLEGSLAYMSPEQTGRMNRAVDNRSDLYSLGVVFFEMLTGRLPFEGRDALEWVHCHIARPAPSPHVIAPNVPEPISAITLKLLSKAPEARYQTASGLAADLARCLAWIVEGDAAAPFPLAMRDVPDHLELPQRLYGRKQELAVLEGSFRRVVGTARCELTLVSGCSGTGKSALVHELSRSVRSANGVFLSGKLEQYGGSTHAFALANLFRPHIRELFGVDEPELAGRREALTRALGPSARLMTDSIPELALLLGSQPDVPSLGALDDEQRFHVLFTRFVEVFADTAHPLVLFLDDLQWADEASLKLLEHVVTYSSAPLLAIGAYRDDEVASSHPLVEMSQRLRASKRLVDEVVVGPLSLTYLTELVTDAVRRPADEVRGLAEVLLTKTGGNPFFACQFLAELAQQRLLFFDRASHAWRWDLGGVAAQGYTDNVVDLMVVRLQKLPPQTLSTVQLAAAVGSVVSEKVLTMISEQNAEELARELLPAVDGGLLVRTGDGYRFAHDRVQEAAYALIPESDRPTYHVRIGRLLLESTPVAVLSDTVFEIVRQLNTGMALLSQEERERVGELNRIAGRKARTTASYATAANHLATSVSLLRADAWNACPAFAFELHLERAECEVLAGNFELAESVVASLQARARTKRQLADLARAEIVIHVVVGDNVQAAAVGLRCLRDFGIEWSAQPSWHEVEIEYERLVESLGGREIEELLDLPALTDLEAAAVLDVLVEMKVPSLFTNGNLFCLVTCRMAATSIGVGHFRGSGVVYLSLAMALVQFFNRYDEAYRFAKLGYGLVERFGLPVDRARVYLDFALVSAWSRPLADNRLLLEKALELARAGADITHACYIYASLLSLLVACGAPLPEVLRLADEGLKYARSSKVRLNELALTSQHRLILQLLGRTDSFTWSDANFDEARHEQAIEANRASLAIAICHYNVWKLMGRFLAGDYEAALSCALTAEGVLWSSPSFIEIPEYHYYHGLTRAMLCDRATPEAKAAHLEQLRAECERFRAWSEACPENFLHRHVLLAAEAARVEGDDLGAAKLYERAIALARQHGFSKNEAHALELAGRYYLDRGFDRIGETYLAAARAGYLRWGAIGKVQQLEKLYPQIATCSGIAGAPTLATRTEDLDLLSVMKASQSIAEETDLDDLIRRLMRVVVVQSGARRGCLLLMTGGLLQVRAEARSTESGGIETCILSGAPTVSGLVPESLVKYVRRTREQVILADASDEKGRSRFVPPDYLARFRPKSVLCRPIVRRSSVVGVLYLENDLVTHAFTSERVTVLEVLASQTAISLEIASSLHEERRTREALARSESRFRRLYDSNMIGILFANLNGEIMEANDYVLRMLQYTRRELDSGAIRWTEITPPEYAPADKRAIEELRLTGVSGPFEKQYLRKEGTRVPVLLGIARLEGCQEETIAFVVDMTEREQLLLQERQARAAAEQAVSARDEFMALAAHELRTPLTPLTLQLRMLQDAVREEWPTATGHRKQLLGLFASAEQQVDRLTHLIDDLLNVTKLETGGLTLHLEVVDFAELVRDVVDRHRAEWTKADSPVKIQANRPVIGRWDRRRIGQVVVNLLANAIKFGSGRPIDIAVSEDAGHAHLSVRDRGMGIAQEDQERIFEKLGRAVSSRHYGGFGLGLHICRQIVRAHRGNIRVESRLGEGATFIVDLPLAVDLPSTSVVASARHDSSSVCRPSGASSSSVTEPSPPVQFGK